MQKHWKPLLLSVFLFGGLYVVLSQLPPGDAEAKPPAELNALGGDGREAGPYDLASGKVLTKVIEEISNNYIDPGRIKPQEMYLASLDYLSKSVAEIMAQPDKDKKQVTLYVDSYKKTFSVEKISNTYELKQAMKEVFSFLAASLPKGTDLREIEYNAINGLLSTLDPHTVLLKPDLSEDMRTSTQGTFGGLGIQIGIQDGGLTVIAPMDGTPAARAGIKAQDKIVKINDESTVNMDTDEAVERLRGAPGTDVTITIARKSWTSPKDFTLTRAEIKIESVTARALSDNVGYVRIKNFQANTTDDMMRALSDFKRKGVTKGLILDLRNNPGGLLDQAVKVSDAYLKRGNIVATVGVVEGRSAREARDASDDGNEWTAPVVVLLSSGSASASEIVAGALKNNDRAVIVGEQSFGKGSVQVLREFPDHSSLKLTIAQYLTPGDISIQGVGVTPDVQLLPSSVTKERITYFTSDSSTKEADLDAHLTSAYTAAPQEPEVKLHYFFDIDAEEKKRKAVEGESNPFVEDPEIVFARLYLNNASGKTRKDLVSSGKSFFEKYASEQEALISGALGGLSIDWSDAQSISTPGASTADFSIDKGTSLTAGDEIKLNLSVKNTGSRPLYRVRAESKSDNPFFNELEFFLGKVNAGETRSFSIPIKLPKDAVGRTDDVTLSLFEAGGSAPAPITKSVQIKGLDRPVFSYGYRIVDDEGGNGDGLLQVGETVKFVLTVKNTGKGKSYETLAALKSYAGKSILLKDGRTNVDNLLPGDQKSAVFSFDVRAKPERGKAYSFEISVYDTALREYVSEKISFPVYEQGPTISKEASGLVTKNEGISLFGGADASAPVIGSFSKGSQLSSVAKVGDFFKVSLADGTAGFVRADDVKSGEAKPEKAKFSATLQNSPPAVSLDAQSGLVVSGDTLKLGGQVTDETRIQDLYILVNGKKAFYQSNPGAKGKLKFSSSLPLEAGINRIEVVARENEDVTSREFLIVRRAK
jgi:carboxyl-terminal processing protease